MRKNDIKNILITLLLFNMQNNDVNAFFKKIIIKLT